jgi:hypothetical protein
VNILAIDLGETTGYVILKGETLGAHGALPLHAVATSQSLPGPYELIDIVVIERPAYRERPAVQEQYEHALYMIRLIFGTEKVKVVRPADWMPRFNRYPLPGRGVLKTQHEKDAYRMAHWALEKFGGQK